MDSKTLILYVFSKFYKGNFNLLDKNDKEILQVINIPTNPIPIVKIYNEDGFFDSIYNKSELGLGESYMRGEWECVGSINKNDQIDSLIDFLNTLCHNQYNPDIPKVSLKTIFSSSQEYDKSNIKHHYDVGNDFYLKFLQDDLNAYSCGFWFSPLDTLNDAQYNKVHTILKK